MPIPKRRLNFHVGVGSLVKKRVLTLLLFFSVFCFSSFAETEPEGEAKGLPLHFSADHQIWNRKTNVVELHGHASVTQPGETIAADEITLNLTTYDMVAQGKASYVTSEVLISGELLEFNLLTRLGRIEKGKVTTERFSLRGERLEKLDHDRYLSQWGEYTTCVDCAPSWSIEAEQIDFRSENYAYFTNVFTRVKDAPSLWIPYLIFPTKTKRQSGVLFPKFSFGSGVYGSTFVLPFFWAIDRSVDMTLGLGIYSAMGPRLEWEGRYALNHGHALIHFSGVRDRQFNSALQSVSNSRQPYRWGLEVSQFHELAPGFKEYLSIKEVSDNFYPFIFPNDVTSLQESFLGSQAQLTLESETASYYLGAYRYRNLLNTNPQDPRSGYNRFDPRTVQVFPRFVSHYRDQMILGPNLLGGLNFELSHFTRQAGFFDYDQTSVPFGQLPPLLTGPAFRPGVDPIRTGTRLSFNPKVYSTYRLFDLLSVSPSLEYRGFFYAFDSKVTPSNLSRGYVVFQTDLSAQLEKIYDFGEGHEDSKAKHLVRPLLTYSYIPEFLTHVSDANHPFLNQIKWGQQLNSNKSFSYNYYFDNHDIVPITYTQNNANYFVPLGNSLAYGLTSQWIRRKQLQGELNPQYKNTVEFKAGQAINFLEYSQPSQPRERRPLTRLFTSLNLNFDSFEMQTNYAYYADLPSSYSFSRHAVNTTASFIFARETHQRILSFERSLSFSYSFDDLSGLNSATTTMRFSLSDYLQPAASLSYGFKTSVIGTHGQWQRAGLSLLIQSPSQCWRFLLAANYAPGPGLRWAPDFSLNLVGSGFDGVSGVTAGRPGI